MSTKPTKLNLVANVELNLDEMIMDVEARQQGDRVIIKFVAIKGGYGPELNLSYTLAARLFGQLVLLLEGKKP